MCEILHVLQLFKTQELHQPEEGSDLPVGNGLCCEPVHFMESYLYMYKQHELEITAILDLIVRSVRALYSSPTTLAPLGSSNNIIISE